LELALAIRNNLPGSSRHFFPFFLSESNEDHQSPSEKRGFVKTLPEAFGEELGFSIYYCKADPPLKKKIGGGPPLLLSM